MKKENISNAFLKEKNEIDNDLKRKNIMKDIELKTQKKIESELINGKITNPIVEKNIEQKQNNIDILQSILENSADEFKKKMGRSMTYSEMREMYG